MIEGFSILLPTYNMLPWLKICLESIGKNSRLKNQVCIHVDGSTDGTVEWLKKVGISHTVGQHRGMYTAWNKAAEQASKEYFFQGEDDLYFCPGWDTNLAKWLEEVEEDTVIITRLVEPFPGSFPPIVDCGRTPEDFNEEKLVEWVKNNSEHKLMKQHFGLWTIRREVWRKIGGYDEAYNPTGTGNADLRMKMYKEGGMRKWRMACDVMIYHFKPQPDIIPHAVDHSNVMKNVDYFTRKWGMSPQEAVEKIWQKE